MPKLNTALELLGLAAFLLAAFTQRRRLIARALKLPPPRNRVRVEKKLRVPMPDGTHLATDHYFPDAPGRFPTILLRTPYGRDPSAGLLGIVHTFAAQRFAERGYHVLIQDVRGRFDSEGAFIPFVNEARDGNAMLDWIARQEWFDGNLGMWGQSYNGYTAWCAAQNASPIIKAIVPSIAGSQMHIFPLRAFALDTLIPWVYQLNRTGNLRERLLHDLRRQIFPETFKRFFRVAFMHLPLIEADARVAGKPVPYYRAWLNNPPRDEADWKANGHGARVENVRAPAHLISGWYDILLNELTRDYAALRAAGQSPYLTIGPWIHQNPACMTETLRQGIVWFDAHLRGDASRVRAQPVRVYVMGANREAWREYDAWPPTHSPTRFYLQAARGLSTELPPENSAPDHYRYDPADPTPAVGGPLFFTDPGPQDNRALEARADVLTFTTPRLTRAFEAIGPVRVELYVQSSLAHADFFARVCDVYPDGKSINICDSYFRVAPGIGAPQPDGSLRIEFELLPTAYRFRAGHCLRLQISSGAHPRFNRNLGTGEPIGTGTRMLAADQTIYHDAAHPSAVVLPVINHLDAD